MSEPSKSVGSDPHESRFKISVDDLRKYDWQSLLASCSGKACSNSYQALLLEAKRLEEATDDLGHRVHALLYVVASFHPNYEMRGNPYGSMWSGFNGRRSLNTEDLTDDDLTASPGSSRKFRIQNTARELPTFSGSPKNDYKAAQLAIDAFLESAARLKNGDNWPPYVERLDRAARLAAYRGSR
jgi:hypothetical protein